MIIEHLPPHNVEAEEAVLGSVLIDPEAIYRINFLKAEFFYIIKHQWVWDACGALAERHEPIDFLTVTQELAGRNQLDELGGPVYISHLINVVPTALHAEGYARIVAEHARRRALLKAASRVAELAYALDRPVDEVEAEALRALMEVPHANGQMLPAATATGEVLDLVLDWAEHPLAPGDVRGLATGFRALDRALGGLSPDTLSILAARPGMGKSALAFALAENIARCQQTVAIFSLEMSRRLVMARLTCARAGVNWLRVKQGLTDGDDLQRMIQELTALGHLPLHISDATDLTTAQVRAEVARLQARQPVSLVVVDHLGLLADPDDNDVRRLGNITWALKRIAKDFHVPVLAIAQLNRGVELRQDKRPLLADLRESGRIEENADIVMMLYRERYYQPESAQDEVEVIIRKNRDGENQAIAHLRFEESFARFSDCPSSQLV